MCFPPPDTTVAFGHGALRPGLEARDQEPGTEVMVLQLGSGANAHLQDSG